LFKKIIFILKIQSSSLSAGTQKAI